MRYIHEFMIVFLVVLGIIFFDIVFQNYFFIRKTEIENMIADISNLISNENIDEAKEKSKILYDKWFEFESKASFFAEHNELEKVSIRVSLIKKSLEIDEKEEAERGLTELKFLIDHIYEKDKLKMKNIF